MTFYFYDLETSGTNPREQRVMQFAGVRTNEKLEPIGDPHNMLIKLSPDILPEPDAILIHGVTPQKANEEGYSEADFLKIFHDEIATPQTIFLGFNNVRFDDEFMRYMNWRNFYDAYEWQWKDGRGRWDLLDMVRMTRALRPDGIEWPYGPDGKESNRLELLTSMNGLKHEKAHDALSDVWACIDLSRLLKSKQPKLFDYLLKIRDKKQVAAMVDLGKPFVYTCGKYSSEFHKTTVVIKIADNPNRQGALVYDLRFDPTEFLNLTSPELAERIKYTRDDDAPTRLPIKALAYNKCPAIAPMSVLDESSRERIALTSTTLELHQKILADNIDNFLPIVLEAFNIIDKERQGSFALSDSTADAQLYGGFLGDEDRNLLIRLHEDIENLNDYRAKLKDNRLREILPLYKARNYPEKLSGEERESWEEYRQKALMDGGVSSKASKFFKRLSELSARESLTANDQYLLEELNLYGQLILPIST